jgi:hypothetical protein
MDVQADVSLQEQEKNRAGKCLLGRCPFLSGAFLVIDANVIAR